MYFFLEHCFFILFFFFVLLQDDVSLFSVYLYTQNSIRKLLSIIEETNFAPNGNIGNLHMVTMLTKPAVPIKAFKRIL